MSIVLGIAGMIVQLLFYVDTIGIGLFIQVKLSKSENKYLDFIMPLIAFHIRSLATLGIVQTVYEKRGDSYD